MREHWASRLGFILAACGSAVGLGTLWKFPYVTGENGGGIFLLLYLGFTLFLAVPLFIGEVLLGRKSERGAVGAFIALSPDHKNWRVVGWLGVLSCFLILSYYCVVAGWGLSYLMMSLNQYLTLHPVQDIPTLFATLASSADISLFWATIFLLMTFGVVMKGVRQGIEFWSRILMTALVALLLLLVFYAVTLEGFKEGVHFLFSFDMSRLKPSSFVEALGLSFFTLSLAQGVMITYGSYLRSSDDIPVSALIIGATVIGISLLSAMVIFPIIFTFNLPIEEGEGLIFKTLPLLFAQLPGAMILSTVFFALFVFAGLTSSVALVEVIVANLIDLFTISRKKAVWITALACFIVVIPSAFAFTPTLFSSWPSIFGTTFFGTLDKLVSVWLLPFGGFLTATYIGWHLKHALVQEQFALHSKLAFLFRPWFFLLRWVAPLAIILIFLESSGIINLDRLTK